MKKILLSFLTLSLLTSISLADCACHKNKSTCEKQPSCDIEKMTSNHNKYQLEDDDEYCTYNQCFFDKRYRNLKKSLCLSKKQETCIDNIYRNFKSDMENQHTKYRVAKNRLLDMIECENDCYKNQVKNLKEIKKETKQKAKEYKNDLKEQLCKSQYSTLKKHYRHEKKKMKKIVKYGAIYKFPCTDCCK